MPCVSLEKEGCGLVCALGGSGSLVSATGGTSDEVVFSACVADLRLSWVPAACGTLGLASAAQKCGLSVMLRRDSPEEKAFSVKWKSLQKGGCA